MGELIQITSQLGIKNSQGSSYSNTCITGKVSQKQLK